MRRRAFFLTNQRLIANSKRREIFFLQTSASSINVLFFVNCFADNYPIVSNIEYQKCDEVIVLGK